MTCDVAATLFAAQHCILLLPQLLLLLRSKSSVACEWTVWRGVNYGSLCCRQNAVSGSRWTASDRCNNCLTAGASSRCIIETDIDWGVQMAPGESPRWIFTLSRSRIHNLRRMRARTVRCVSARRRIAQRYLCPWKPVCTGLFGSNMVPRFWPKVCKCAHEVEAVVRQCACMVHAQTLTLATGVA